MANPYTDEVGIYHNKLGITDADELKRVEYDLTTRRAQEILAHRVDLGVQNFGLARQQAIHLHLFQDVYEWAGKVRTVPSSRRMDNGMVSVFAEPADLEPRWRTLEKKTHAYITTGGLTFAQKREALTGIFIEANHLHPFPDGNGRSLQVFMKQLAQAQGIDLDYSKVNAEEWNHASAVSGTHGELFEHMHLIPVKPDLEPISKIFQKIVS
ncbi:MAG: Fic family protein [Methylobacillus sp.]|jgi:cell filamentation protein|nr:Fic family protein [Methylobacillus sp.]